MVHVVTIEEAFSKVHQEYDKKPRVVVIFM